MSLLGASGGSTYGYSNAPVDFGSAGGVTVASGPLAFRKRGWRNPNGDK